MGNLEGERLPKLVGMDEVGEGVAKDVVLRSLVQRKARQRKARDENGQ